MRNIDIREGLTYNQREAAKLLVAGHSISNTAVKREVAERTLYHWRALPDFKKFMTKLSLEQEELDRERKTIVNASLAASELKAVKEIERLLDDPTVSDGIKSRAAFDLLRLNMTKEAERLSDGGNTKQLMMLMPKEVLSDGEIDSNLVGEAGKIANKSDGD